MTEFRPISFEQWKVKNPDFVDEQCEECDGSGNGVCIHCGGETDCESCGGTGVIGDSAKIRYLEIVERERRMFNQMFGTAA